MSEEFASRQVLPQGQQHRHRSLPLMQERTSQPQAPPVITIPQPYTDQLRTTAGYYL